MSGYILNTNARFDLLEIWDYIAGDSPNAADRWIDQLFDAFEALAETPTMGHVRQDLTARALLFWPVGRYLIIYRADRRPIEIVAVTHGSRDIPSFLGQRLDR